MPDIEAFIRPSALEQLDLCAGSALLQALVVERWGQPGSSEQAEAGAYAHAAIALSLSQRSRILVALTTLHADEFTIAMAQRCLDFAWMLIDLHQIEPEHVLPEHHLACSAWGLPRGGTADLVLVVPFKKLFVIDWKTGFLDQGDAVDHVQIMAYGCAGAETFRVPYVEVILFQPRLPRAERVTRASFDAEQVRQGLAYVREVTARAREQLTAAQNGMALETRAGYQQCKYCRALPFCRTARTYMQDAIEVQELIGATTPPEWGSLADAAKLAESFAEASKELVKRHLAGGGCASGWKLVDGRAMTRIDPMLAMQSAQAAGELPRLLQFARFNSEAADVLECISGAVSVGQSAPSLRQDKRAKT